MVFVVSVLASRYWLGVAEKSPEPEVSHLSVSSSPVNQDIRVIPMVRRRCMTGSFVTWRVYLVFAVIAVPG